MLDVKSYKGRIVGPSAKIYFEIGRYWCAFNKVWIFLLNIKLTFLLCLYIMSLSQNPEKLNPEHKKSWNSKNLEWLKI
jgi:hypothetical protein